jgi:hypothetical protein
VLLGDVLGASNVKHIGNNELSSSFSGHVVGCSVIVIDEVHIAGESKQIPWNNIKGMITDRTAVVHPKGVDAFNSVNFVNYVLSTNHYNALPISAEERRIFALDSGANSIEELQMLLDIHRQALWTAEGSQGDVAPLRIADYFTALYEAVRDHAPALRTMLLSYEFVEGFSHLKKPPTTDAKLRMIDALTTPADDFMEQVLADNHPGVTKDVINAMLLKEAMSRISVSETPGMYKIYQMLSKLGFRKLSAPVRTKQGQIRLWVKNIKVTDYQLAIDKYEESFEELHDFFD